MCVYNTVQQFFHFISLSFLINLGTIKSLCFKIFPELVGNPTSRKLEEAIHRAISRWRQSMASVPRVSMQGRSRRSGCWKLFAAATCTSGLGPWRSCRTTTTRLEKAHQRRPPKPGSKTLFLLQ